MANVYDVADFFIDVCNNSTDDQITNLKLNKLLYYAQRMSSLQFQLGLCLDLRLRGSIRCINRAKKRSKNRQRSQF